MQVIPRRKVGRYPRLFHNALYITLRNDIPGATVALVKEIRSSVHQETKLRGSRASSWRRTEFQKVWGLGHNRDRKSETTRRQPSSSSPESSSGSMSPRA